MQDGGIESPSWKAAFDDISVNTLTWQRQVIRELQRTTRFKDLVDFLDDDDANTRIVVAQFLGNVNESLTSDQRGAAIDCLLRLLADPACNEYEYGLWQADDETVMYVSATAAEALAKLGYATDASEAFLKAQSQGIQVVVAKNHE